MQHVDPPDLALWPTLRRLLPLWWEQRRLVALGLAIAVFLGRYASIRAVPDAVGLTVRNLMLTRRVTWDEVLEVRFPDGAPWVTLELADTDELAVMAIQRADGATAMAEAQRLAGLVRDLGEAR